MKDSELIKRCLQFDKKCQRLLYDRFSSQMYSVCLRYFDETFEAQEALQLGFIKVFKNLHTFKGDGPLGAWIRRIIVNESLNLLKKNKKYKNYLNLDQVQIQSFQETSHLDFTEIDQYVQLMPLGYKTIFNLFVVDDYTHKEIAKILSISESTSRTQLRKARNFLKTKMEYKLL